MTRVPSDVSFPGDGQGDRAVERPGSRPSSLAAFLASGGDLARHPAGVLVIEDVRANLSSRTPSQKEAWATRLSLASPWLHDGETERTTTLNEVVVTAMRWAKECLEDEHLATVVACLAAKRGLRSRSAGRRGGGPVVPAACEVARAAGKPVQADPASRHGQRPGSHSFRE